jgi:hypothetical protein
MRVNKAGATQERERTLNERTNDRTMSHSIGSKKCPTCKAWLVMNKCGKCGFSIAAPTPASSSATTTTTTAAPLSAASMSSAAAEESKSSRIAIDCVYTLVCAELCALCRRKATQKLVHILAGEGGREARGRAQGGARSSIWRHFARILCALGHCVQFDCKALRSCQCGCQSCLVSATTDHSEFYYCYYFVMRKTSENFYLFIYLFFFQRRTSSKHAVPANPPAIRASLTEKANQLEDLLESIDEFEMRADHRQLGSVRHRSAAAAHGLAHRRAASLARRRRHRSDARQSRHHDVRRHLCARRRAGVRLCSRPSRSRRRPPRPLCPRRCATLFNFSTTAATSRPMPLRRCCSSAASATTARCSSLSLTASSRT